MPSPPAPATPTSTSRPRRIVLIPATELVDGVTHYRIDVPDLPPPGMPDPPPRHRYSDFLRLHDQLARQFPTLRSVLLTEIPPLPPKAWFRNAASVVHTRQTLLAAHLSALLSTPPFATCATLRDFLGIPEAQWRAFHTPPGTAAQADGSGAGAGPRLSAMDVPTSPVQWLAALHDVQAQVIQLKRALSDRDTLLRAGDALRAQATASQAARRAEQLRLNLNILESTLSRPPCEPMSDLERTRRQTLLLTTIQDVNDIQLRLRAGPAATVSTTAVPTSSSPSNPPRRVLGRPSTSPPVTTTTTAYTSSSSPPPPPVVVGAAARVDVTTLNNQGLLQLQQQHMNEQDAVAGALLSVTQRLKMIGHAMNDELDTQNQLLDETAEDMDRVSGRVGKVHRKAKKVAGEKA
ncbi:hypothetical protein GGF32_000027 [Allomyces javanicus]|nr:hypothetical protein GGF32_000027 [Allomyces javanicus]